MSAFGAFFFRCPIGLLISSIGISHGNEIARFTFGVPELRGGLSLVAGLIGIFAIPQVLSMIADLRRKEFIAEYNPERGQTMKTIVKVMSHPFHVVRSAVIGSFIGILPGAGSPIAALVSYNEAVRWSKDKTQFGKGDLRGIRKLIDGGDQQQLNGQMRDGLVIGIQSNATAIDKIRILINRFL